jgi:hypothetical protein
VSFPIRVPFFKGLELQEASLQRLLAEVELRISVVTETEANLKAKFLELRKLRQLVRKVDRSEIGHVTKLVFSIVHSAP